MPYACMQTRGVADPESSSPEGTSDGSNSYILKTQISVSFLAYRQSGPLGCHITYQLGESICVGVSSAFFRSFAESIHRAGGPCFQRPASLSAVEQPAPVVVVSVDASSFESVHWDPRSSRNLNTTHRGSLSKTVEARVSPRHFWTRGIGGINYARGVGWCALARSRLVVIHGFWLPSRNGSHQEERCDSTARWAVVSQTPALKLKNLGLNAMVPASCAPQGPGRRASLCTSGGGLRPPIPFCRLFLLRGGAVVPSLVSRIQSLEWLRDRMAGSSPLVSWLSPTPASSV